MKATSELINTISYFMFKYKDTITGFGLFCLFLFVCFGVVFLQSKAYNKNSGQ